MIQLTDESVDRLSVLLNADGSKIDSEATLLSAAETALSEARNDALQFKADADAKTAELSAATEKLTQAEAKVTELSAAQKPGTVLELSAASTSTLTDRIENASLLTDGIVKDGDLPKYIGDKLVNLAASMDDQQTAIVMLSRDEGGKSIYRNIIELFRGAGLGIKADGKSKAGVQLSRNVPDAPPAPVTPETNELLQEARRLAGVAK